MHNAIHAASTLDDAESEIKLVFGDVEFQWDGVAQKHGIAWKFLLFFFAGSCLIFIFPILFLFRE